MVQLVAMEAPVGNASATSEIHKEERNQVACLDLQLQMDKALVQVDPMAHQLEGSQEKWGHPETEEQSMMT